MSIEIRPNPATAGSVTGALTYKGSYNATTNTPDLTSSLKGDFYIVSVAGTLAGVTLNVGDHIVFNQNASSPITSAMFDVIDNTDAVSSVNGATGVVVLDLQDINDVNATLTPSDSTFLVGDGSEWIGESGATARTSLGLTIGTDVQAHDAQLDDVAGLTPADGAFIVGDGTNFVTETLGTARTSLGLGSAATEDVGTGANNVVQLDGSSRLPAVDGSQLTNLPGGSDTLDDVVGRGATTASSIQTGGLTVTGDIDPNADDTYFIGNESTRFISYYGDVNGAIRFKAKNDSGGTLNKGEVVYIKGISGTVPTVDKARANASGTMPAFGLVFANANDQAEVQIITFGNLNDFNTSTFSAGDTVFVSSATAGALVNTAPTGESNFIQNIGRVVRSDASAGIIKVGGAGRTNATPNLDQNKIFLGNASNQAVSTALSSIALSGFNNDLTLNNVVSNGSTTSTPITVGDLKINSNAAGTSTSGSIATTASNINIKIDPHGSGVPELVGNATRGSGQVKFNCEQNSHGIILKGPPHSAAASYTMILPDALGTNGQVLSLQDATTGEMTFTSAGAGDLLASNNLSDLTNFATARTNLGVAIGSDVQAYDAQLADIAGLATTDGGFIVGNGTNFVLETLGTARTSLGLGSAATEDVGTSANNVVQLDASSRLPAVDGSQLTNLPGGGDLLSTNNLSDLTNFATARTNLGVAIGSDVQAYDAQLADIAGLTPTDSNFIVGDGSNFVLESGATARTSLGLTIGTDVQAYDAQLADIAGLTPTDGNIIIGNGTNFITESGATARTSLGLSIGSDVQAYDAQLADVAGLTPADGAFIVGDGTNFVTETLGTARTSLGLGTVATLDVGTGANNVVQLDGSSRLPAVDGSQLTNLPGGGSKPTVTTDSSGTSTTISTYTGIEEIHLINNGSNNVTITIPTASTVASGYKYNIKRLGSGSVTVQSQSVSSGNNQIDGSNTFSLASANDSVTLVSNGTTFFII